LRVRRRGAATAASGDGAWNINDVAAAAAAVAAAAAAATSSATGAEKSGIDAALLRVRFGGAEAVGASTPVSWEAPSVESSTLVSTDVAADFLAELFFAAFLTGAGSVTSPDTCSDSLGASSRGASAAAVFFEADLRGVVFLAADFFAAVFFAAVCSAGAAASASTVDGVWLVVDSSSLTDHAPI